jgi:Tol biopolymer transport system component
VPRKVSGTLAAGGDVLSQFLVSPDGFSVAYVADQATDGVFELYQVSLDGNQSPRRVNGPLVSGGGVFVEGVAFEFSPDSRRIVYIAGQDTASVLELYGSVVTRPARQR